MRTHILTTFLAAFALLTLTATSAGGGHLDRSAHIDGVRLYLGLMSAEELLMKARTNPALYPVHKIPKAPHMYHVVVALFDGTTGERIDNAKVMARISPLALSGQRRPFTPW